MTQVKKRRRTLARPEVDNEKLAATQVKIYRRECAKIDFTTDTARDEHAAVVSFTLGLVSAPAVEILFLSNLKSKSNGKESQ